MFLAIIHTLQISLTDIFFILNKEGGMMYTFYCNCLMIGLGILLLSLILDGISDLFQGITLFDVHFDCLPGILPLSPLQICAFLVGFGGLGVTLYSRSSFHLLFSILLGLLLSYGTHFLLHKLRQVNSETISAFDLIGCEGKVIVTIFENGVGSVALNTEQGKISYSAQSDHTIKQGSTIKVIDIKGSILIVSDSPTFFLHQAP